MAETTMALVIQVQDAHRLKERFGQHMFAQVMAELGDKVCALSASLLAQHETLAHRRRDEHGFWATLFRLRDGMLPRDFHEACDVIEAAGRKLVFGLPAVVMGSGTGMKFPVRLAVHPLGLNDWAAHGEQYPAQWLEAVFSACGKTDARHVAAAKDIAAILADPCALRTLLQPIVSMRDRAVVGYEALSRGPRGSALESPAHLFDAAHACGRLVDMELYCAQLALQRTQGRLRPGRFLTLNLGPQALAQAADALPLAGRGGVLFELTEHLPLDGTAQLAGVVDGLRAQGIGLALDDTGCGFADLDTARVLRPDIVKLCMAVIRRAGQGAPFDTDIGAAVQSLRNMGCRVLAEGVETPDQHAALLNHDIELAQGWLYGRPADVDDVLPAKALIG